MSSFREGCDQFRAHNGLAREGAPKLHIVARVRVVLEVAISGYEPTDTTEAITASAQVQAKKELDRLLDRSSTSAGRYIRPVEMDVVSVTSTIVQPKGRRDG